MAPLAGHDTPAGEQATNPGELRGELCAGRLGSGLVNDPEETRRCADATLRVDRPL
jgi:hypothetical protein